MAYVVLVLESGTNLEVRDNSIQFKDSMGGVSSRELSQEEKDRLLGALKDVTQWAHAGMDYFILFDGLDFWLKPYWYGEELQIKLTKEERVLLAHILSL